MGFSAFSRSLIKQREGSWESLSRNAWLQKFCLKTIYPTNSQENVIAFCLVKYTWTKETSYWTSSYPNRRYQREAGYIFVSNDISFTFPGRNNQVHIGINEQVESLFKPKKYLLWTFSELHGILSKEEGTDLSNLKFSTIYCYTTSKK